MIQAARRPLLDRPVKCPSCGHPTIVDPCAHCNVFLPKTLGGTRTYSDDSLSNAAAARLERRVEEPELEEAGA